MNVVKIADNVSFNDAAAVSMVGMTSWHMLVGRAKIKPGQLVLIMGGGSGVGMVGIQIAKLYNCTVIATAGNKDKMDKCMELGADYTVNHREADWYKKVREITKKMGVNPVSMYSLSTLANRCFPRKSRCSKWAAHLLRQVQPQAMTRLLTCGSCSLREPTCWALLRELRQNLKM